MRVILFTGKGGVGKTSVTAESILSEDPKRDHAFYRRAIAQNCGVI